MNMSIVTAGVIEECDVTTLITIDGSKLFTDIGVEGCLPVFVDYNLAHTYDENQPQLCGCTLLYGASLQEVKEALEEEFDIELDDYKGNLVNPSLIQLFEVV